ncbi:MAG TPA: zinc metalloprotease HtpX [Armatimonadota bacterium]|nr:zinc metalloprotease HtpX [Armatimonadota bacterium]
MNALKTGFLLTVLTLVLIAVGRLVGGPTGMAVAFGFALVMNAMSYWFSDRIVLAMYRAQPISEAEAPELHTIVGRLTLEAGLPMPKLYVVPGDMPNAFATGRNPEHAAVAVTEGLLGILDRDEVEGVIAHELAHVGNRDILISTIAATLAGAIMMLASMARWGIMLSGIGRSDDDNGGVIGLLVVLFVAPLAALTIQMAVSRSREYQADATGAQVSGKPLGLANALVKLEEASKRVPSQVNPATAHMFIVNPLRGGAIGRLFSTHPPIPERVNRLRSMAERMGR